MPAVCFQISAFFPSAPLHPNCYLSPTQFAEKFPKLGTANAEDGKTGETAREIPERREKEEEEKGDAGGGDVGVPTETAAEPEAVSAASEDANICIQQSEIKYSHPFRTTLFVVLGAILGTLATLIVTGHLNVAAMVEQVRRLLKL